MKIIEPVSNVWVNCYVNNIFSIITSIEPSYQKLIYENAYNYAFLGRCDWFKSLAVNDYKLYSYCNLIHIDTMVIDRRDIINRIIDLLNKGNVVFLKVDLYNWLPKGIDYNKRHVYHETLIVRNDISKKSFYILDDDVTGYSKHIVTYDFVSNALEDVNYISIRFAKLPEKLPKYQYNMEVLLENAKNLLNNIISISYSSLWNTYNNCEEIIDLVTESTKIVERQKANKYFF